MLGHWIRLREFAQPPLQPKPLLHFHVGLLPVAFRQGPKVDFRIKMEDAPSALNLLKMTLVLSGQDRAKDPTHGRTHQDQNLWQYDRNLFLKAPQAPTQFHRRDDDAGWRRAPRQPGPVRLLQTTDVLDDEANEVV